MPDEPNVTHVTYAIGFKVPNEFIKESERQAEAYEAWSKTRRGRAARVVSNLMNHVAWGVPGMPHRVSYKLSKLAYKVDPKVAKWEFLS